MIRGRCLDWMCEFSFALIGVRVVELMAYLLQWRLRFREGTLAPARRLRPGKRFGGLRSSSPVAVVAAKVLLLTASLLQARPPK